jgi:hypothetical protein
LLITCNIVEKELYNILRVDHKLVYSIFVKYATYYYGTVIEITGSCINSNLVKILQYIITYLREKKTKYVDQKILNNAKKLLLLYRYNHIKNPMEIAEFYESQYLLNEMQERHRARDKSKEKEEEEEEEEHKKTVCKIYSEMEFDKIIETINVKHIQMIINMIDFGAIIIGYMGKKNLHLNMSDFI